jgi:hypothetical protein
MQNVLKKRFKKAYKLVVYKDLKTKPKEGLAGLQNT